MPFKTISSLLILSNLLLLNFNVQCQDTVFLKANNYSGTYQLGSETPPVFRDTFRKGDGYMVTSPNGRYFINTGATIGSCSPDRKGTSNIYFNTDPKGKIDPGSICPKASVTLINANTLRFETSSITLKRNHYSGDLLSSFMISGDGTHLLLDPAKKKIYNLIKSHTYYLFCGSINSLTTPIEHYSATDSAAGEAMQSGFYFSVESSGNVTLQDARAAATVTKAGKCIKLNTSRITVRDSWFNSKGHIQELKKFTL
jgi:hypothetical protein